MSSEMFSMIDATTANRIATEGDGSELGTITYTTEQQLAYAINYAVKCNQTSCTFMHPLSKDLVDKLKSKGYKAVRKDCENVEDCEGILWDIYWDDVKSSEE